MFALLCFDSQFELETDSTYARDMARKMVKSQLEAGWFGEDRFYVKLPKLEAHRNHIIGQVYPIISK